MAVTVSVDNPLPAQFGHDGEFLTTDGSQASWTPIPDSSPAMLYLAANYV